MFGLTSVVFGSDIFSAARIASSPVSPFKSTFQPLAQQEQGLSGPGSDKCRPVSVLSIHALPRACQNPSAHGLRSPGRYRSSASYLG